MFHHHHRVKVYSQSIKNGFILTLADVHDVPVVIINGQGIERKGFLQIVPGARTAITSKNGFFCNFRTDPGRSPSDFTGTATLSTIRTGASVSKVMLSIFQEFKSYLKAVNERPYSPGG